MELFLVGFYKLGCFGFLILISELGTSQNLEPFFFVWLLFFFVGSMNFFISSWLPQVMAVVVVEEEEEGEKKDDHMW